MMRGTDLVGLRVLLVEDEMMVSLLIEDILVDEQCVIVGPFARVPGALAAARTDALDLAILGYYTGRLTTKRSYLPRIAPDHEGGKDPPWWPGPYD